MYSKFATRTDSLVGEKNRELLYRECEEVAAVER